MAEIHEEGDLDFFGAIIMKVKNSQKGFSFIEILVGLALLGIIGVAFLSGLFTTFKGVAVSQEKVTTESLAKSQAEYIKAQDYVAVADYDPSNPANRYELIDIPAGLVAAGYSVSISPPQEVISNDEGSFELQSAVVTVKRNGQSKLSITIYLLSD